MLGTVRLWDNRVPTNSLSPFLNLDVASATSGYGYFDEMANSGFPGEVTSICFDSSGLHMCAGTKGGNVALFDMRSSKPLFIKEHQYGLPIHTGMCVQVLQRIFLAFITSICHPLQSSFIQGLGQCLVVIQSL